MKTGLILLLCVAILMTFAACSASPEPTASAEKPEPVEQASISDAEAAPTAPSEEPGSTANTQSVEGTVSEFNFASKTVTLNNGVEMPILGIGTFQLSIQEAENSVYWALRDGYRLIDTAQMYRNEVGVGRGIQRAIDEGLVTREEIFVTTKIWISDYPNADAAVNRSLENLGLGLHRPDDPAFFPSR